MSPRHIQKLLIISCYYLLEVKIVVIIVIVVALLIVHFMNFTILSVHITSLA